MDIRHHPSRRHGARGATLLELFFVCALLAALATWSAPSFHRFVLDARRATQVSGLFRALQSARSSAVTQALPVVLCKSNNSRDCTPRAKLWSEGWLVFVNRDRDTPPQVDADEPILHIEPASEHVRVSANRDALIYWPISLAGTTASIVFCDERGASEARAIIVSVTGRPRISQRDSSGKALRCF